MKKKQPKFSLDDKQELLNMVNAEYQARERAKLWLGSFTGAVELDRIRYLASLREKIINW